jgi:hypothetical protein
MPMPDRCAFYINLYANPDGPAPYSSAHICLADALDELAHAEADGFGPYQSTIEVTTGPNGSVARMIDLSRAAKVLLLETQAGA